MNNTLTTCLITFTFVGAALLSGCDGDESADPNTQETTMDQSTLTQDGFAAGGYDVVAYFEAGEPELGDAQFTLEHGGATYRFASAKRRDTFAAAPDKYAPQYGGHCAFATSLGKVEAGKPTHFKLEDGKLYLNSNGVANFLFGLMPGRAGKADANWAAAGK